MGIIDFLASRGRVDVPGAASPGRSSRALRRAAAKKAAKAGRSSDG